MNSLTAWKARKPGGVAAIDASTSMVRPPPLGGLAVVVLAPRDVHLEIELRRQAQADRSTR